MQKYFILLIILIVGLNGCGKKKVVIDPNRPLLLITDPKLMPKFYDSFDKESLLASVEKSIIYSQNHSVTFRQLSRQFTQEEIIESLKAFKEILISSRTKEEFDQRIKSNFEIYISQGGNGDRKVLFTGYYQPMINGSYKRTNRYKYPLYSRPKDLVKGTPYLTKKQIDSNKALSGKGLEFIWVDSYLMAHIIHVQGTAVVKLPSGKKINIGYHGDNGRPYTSIIKKIIKDGYIKQEDISLKALEDFFSQNPNLEEKYITMNERYIFFKKIIGGPYGSLGIEVTPKRSLATHKFQNTEYLFPPCGIAFVDCNLPIIDGNRVAYDRATFFAINQDTGSAITGAGRADIYYGVGDNAKQYAGYTHTKGKLYYLKLRR